MSIAVLLIIIFGSPALVILALLFTLGEWFQPVGWTVVGIYAACWCAEAVRARARRAIPTGVTA